MHKYIFKDLFLKCGYWTRPRTSAGTVNAIWHWFISLSLYRICFNQIYTHSNLSDSFHRPCHYPQTSHSLMLSLFLNTRSPFSAACICIGVELSIRAWTFFQSSQTWLKLTYFLSLNSFHLPVALQLSKELLEPLAYPWWGFAWLGLGQIFYTQSQSPWVHVYIWLLPQNIYYQKVWLDLEPSKQLVQCHRWHLVKWKPWGMRARCYLTPWGCIN